MHVAVTGAAGFIGSHTCEALVARGHTVTAIDAFDDYLYSAELKRANARTLARLERLTFVEANICDRAALEHALANADVVCHLAALAGVRPSLVEPLRYLRTNVEGTGVVGEVMRAKGLRRLVFASSSSVYGARTDGQAFDESDPCVTPASPYAASKRMNELQLSVYAELFGIAVTALRYFTVYGPRQRPDMAIAKFTYAIANGEPITLFGDGSSRRDYTYISDIVMGTVAAIERPLGSFVVLNLGGTRTVSLRDLVGTIERIVGKAAHVQWSSNQPGDVPLTYANIDRARAALGFEPAVSLDAGLASYWEWFQERSVASP